MWLLFDAIEAISNRLTSTLPSVLESLVVFFSAFYAARYTSNKDRERDKINNLTQVSNVERNDEKEKIRKYHIAVFDYETEIQQLIDQLSKNKDYLNQCISTLDDPHAISSNLPFCVTTQRKQLYLLRNKELINEWFALEIEIKKLNLRIGAFIKAYDSVIGVAHNKFLTAPHAKKIFEVVNQNVYESEIESIRKFCENLITHTNALLMKSIGFYSLIAIHVKLSDDRFQSIQDLADFGVLKAEYQAELELMQSRFRALLS